VSDNCGTNIFVGRASSGQIGAGFNGLTGGVSIQNAARGVVVEGANAAIIFSSITGAALEGIRVPTGNDAPRPGTELPSRRSSSTPSRSAVNPATLPEIPLTGQLSGRY
jgi:hypothetical protein